MNKTAALAEARQLTAAQIKQRYIDYWNKKGILRHQWLAVSSQIGPVTITKRRQVSYATYR